MGCASGTNCTRYALPRPMQTVRAIYPGTFDPPTNGHLDLVSRGAKIFDHLVVAVLRNTSKGTPLFTTEERAEMLTEATRSYGQRFGEDF